MFISSHVVFHLEHLYKLNVLLQELQRLPKHGKIKKHDYESFILSLIFDHWLLLQRPTFTESCQLTLTWSHVYANFGIITKHKSNKQNSEDRVNLWKKKISGTNFVFKKIQLFRKTKKENKIATCQCTSLPVPHLPL